MARYAVIGWGSLIWDLDTLAESVEGGWQMGAGPALPLEFARVSAKRRQALTVVVDETHGVPCPSHVIASRRGGVGEAVADLAARERAPVERIGAVCRVSGAMQASTPRVAERVADWCAAAGWAGAVWTDLPGNFAEITGRTFAIETAIAYLRTLPESGLAEAVRYIESAPVATDTPLRRALAADPWWRAERRNRGQR